MMGRGLRKTVVALLAVVILTGSLGLSDPAEFQRRPHEEIRFFAGPNATGELLWTIKRVPYFHLPIWWIFQGSSSNYPPIFTYTEEHLYAGRGFYGPILLTFDHDTAYLGPNILGEPLFNLDGDRLYQGRGQLGPILYNFRGERVREGPGVTGAILLNATQDILSFPGPVELVIGALLNGQLPPPAPPIPPVEPTPTIPLPPPPPFQADGSNPTTN